MKVFVNWWSSVVFLVMDVVSICCCIVLNLFGLK